VATDTNMEGIKITSSGNTYNDLTISANRSGANNHIGRIVGQWNGANAAAIIFNTGGDTSSKDDGEMLFATSNGGSSLSTRMVIEQDGEVWLKDGKLKLGTTSGTDSYIYSTNAAGIIYQADENGHTFQTYSGGWQDRLIIKDNGKIGIGEDDPESNHVLIRGSSTVKTKSGHIMLTGDSATVNQGPQIVFSESGSSASYAGAYVGFERKGDNSQGDLIFGTRGSSGDANTVPTERVRLTSTGQFEVKSDLGIFVKSSGDNAGARIKFSTAIQSSYDQIGHIIYYHGDNSIVTGYGEGFVVGGTETNGFIMRMDGGINIIDSGSAGGNGAKLSLGTDQDMRIYHTGGDGFIDGTGTGGLRIRYNDIIISNYNSTGTRRFKVQKEQGMDVFSPTNGSGVTIRMSDHAAEQQIGSISYFHSDNSVVNDGTGECFKIHGTEPQTAVLLEGRLYIDDDKFVMKPTFSNFNDIPNGSSTSTQGVMMRCDASQASSGNSGVISNNQYEPFIANRTGNDGTVIRIRHQSNTEGEIKVNGSSVSYNNFMGAHKAVFADHSKPDLLIGTVMETVDQLATWKYASFSVGVGTDATTKFIPYYGSKNDGETDTITFESNTYNAAIKNYRDPMPEITKHVCVKVSDTVGSKAVFGVFNCWEEEDVIERESGNAEYSWNDLDVAAIGNYFIRMQSGQTPEVGDYVESAGDGTAKVQSDDILRSKTIAKITSTTKQKTYSDGSFLVTCTLHCG